MQHDILFRIMTAEPQLTVENHQELYFWASENGFVWLRNRIIGRPEGEAERFFQSRLPRFHQACLEYAQAYEASMRRVLLDGRLRSEVDTFGERLTEKMLIIDQIAKRLGRARFEERYGELGKICAQYGGSLPTEVEPIWDVWRLGKSHEVIVQLEKAVGEPVPLADIGRELRGEGTDSGGLKIWAAKVHQSLHKTLNPLAFSLLHKALFDCVKYVEVGDRGRALGLLYCRLEALGLDVSRLFDGEQRKWVKDHLVEGAMLSCQDRRLRIGQQTSFGQYRTDSSSDELIDFDPDNPARLLMRLVRCQPGSGAGWDRFIIPITHIDSRGHFALVGDPGSEAASFRLYGDERDARFKKGVCELFQAIVASNKQPEGFIPDEMVRVSADGSVLLLLRHDRTEVLNIQRLEEYLWNSARRLTSGKAAQEALHRQWMSETGLAAHPLANSVRTQFISSSRGTIDGKVADAVEIIKDDYHTRAGEDYGPTVASTVALCLKEDAFQIRRIPSDFDMLLAQRVATDLSLRKKRN